jgi:hypothetical protein
MFEDWRQYYNQKLPHRSLGLQTPAAFAKNQRESVSDSSRATPAFHRKLVAQKKPKLPQNFASKVA